MPSLSSPSLTIIHIVSYERPYWFNLPKLRAEIGSFAKGHPLIENLLFISENSSWKCGERVKYLWDSPSLLDLLWLRLFKDTTLRYRSHFYEAGNPRSIARLLYIFIRSNPASLCHFPFPRDPPGSRSWQLSWIWLWELCFLPSLRWVNLIFLI